MPSKETLLATLTREPECHRRSDSARSLASRTISNRFWYTYALRSLVDGKWYRGFTGDVQKRMGEHERGVSFSTAPRRPLGLAYYEACRSESDARRMETFFETIGGRRYLAKRLRDFQHMRNLKLY